MRSAFESGSGASLSRINSHGGRHVSFRNSTSSEAVSESIPLSRSTRSTTLTTTPPPLPQQILLGSPINTTRQNSRGRQQQQQQQRQRNKHHHRRLNHTAPGGGVVSGAGSRSSSRHPAAPASDPRQWIMVLGQYSLASDSAPSPSAEGGRESATDGEKATQKDGTMDGRDGQANISSSSGGGLNASPPLEERIGLHELKTIMLAFRLPSHSAALRIFRPSSADKMAGAGGAASTATTPPSAASPAAGATRSVSAGSRVKITPAFKQKAPYFVSSDAQTVLDDTVRYVDELSSTVAELLATERETTHLSATSHDLMNTANGFKDEAVLTAAIPKPAMGENAVDSGTVLPLFDPSSATSSATPPPPQLRNLSREEFTGVLRRAVPSATLAEVQSLLAKAIPDNQDTVSWNELATFLVTCSRQKADLAMEDQRFVLAGQPSNLHFEEQHGESITCVAVNRARRLIVTGCSGGSVRAWSSGADLAYRGMLLKVEGWIVGLHWGCRGRVLYVVTMDRSVYVLEGTTYEVLRVFHGRGIAGTPDSVAYATETIGKVNVGGVALPKHRPPNERGYAGARLRVSPSSKAAGAGPPRSGSSARGKAESGEDRMRRLLSSAMQVRRGVQPSPGDGPTTATGAAVAAAAAATAGAGSTSSPATLTATGEFSEVEAGSGLPNQTTLTNQYSLTTSSAAEALHQDNTPLTGAGRGPYVVQHVEEGVLTSLVDAVTATACEESAFQEDVLLLGTSKGDAYLFTLATQNELTPRRVLVARHVFTQLHRGHITKLEFSHAFNALLSSGEDGRVRVTSLMGGQNLRTFFAPDLPEQHTSVTDFAVHPQLKMLLTIGPERRALVWEWNQPTPIAVLESVNRPLCCGAFLGEQLLTVSRDRVLHVYDGKSFRLRQELALRTAGSLTRASSGPTPTALAASTNFNAPTAMSSCMITQLYTDPARQRVLGFGRFPFSLCVKRQVSSGCPARYRGHHAPMLTTLVSRAFGQLVTVGTDGVVMTWTPRTGANEFSFLLANFSNAAATTGAPMPPVVAAMDVLQRRLLTGFAGGVMVAWNVLNGQVERVLTAAASSLPTTAGGAAGAAGAATSQWATAVHDSGVHAGAAGHDERGKAGGGAVLSSSSSPASSAPRRDVTAVGSFLRYRSLSYLFAVGRTLYVDAATAATTPSSAVSHSTTAAGGAGSGVDAGGSLMLSSSPAVAASPQLGEYTTTFPSSWVPQPFYGDITQLLQLSPQHVACGTASGAVLVYNVLSDCQEGAPLWVTEAMLYPPTPSTALFGGAARGAGVASSASTPPTHAARGRSVSNRREHTHPTPAGGNGGNVTGFGSEEGSLRPVGLLGNSTNAAGAAAAAVADTPAAADLLPRSALAASCGEDAASSSGAGGGGGLNRTAAAAAAAANMMGGQRGNVASRTLRLLNLPAVHPRLLIMAQEDGTLSCWHTLRRACIGAVNLAAVGLSEELDSGNELGGSGGGGGGGMNTTGTSAGVGGRHREEGPPGTFVFDMDDAAGDFIVFGDSEGNVHICRTEWQVLMSPTAQVAAMALPNPLLYNSSSPPSASVTTTRGPSPEPQRSTERRQPTAPAVSGGSVDEGVVEEEEEAHKRPRTPTSATTPDFNEAQRSIPLLRRLERVHVFASGLVLAGLRIVDAAAATVFSAASAPTAAEAAPKDPEQNGLASAGSVSSDDAASREMLIVCTGADHYVRVFTLAGLPVGELGMDEWSAANPRTYRYMGELMGVPAAPLPCSLVGNPSWQRDTREKVEASPCYFNYLADLQATHFPRSGLFGGARGSVRHSRVSLGALGLTRRSLLAAAAARATPAVLLDTLSAPALERALSPSAAATATSSTTHRSVSPERRQTAAAAATPQHVGEAAGPVAAGAGNNTTASSAEERQKGKLVELDGAGEDGKAEDGDGADEEAAWLHRAPPTPPHARGLSTRLHRSTRYRYSAQPSSQRGVVKPACVDAVLRAAAARASSSSTPSPPKTLTMRGQQPFHPTTGPTSTTATTTTVVPLPAPSTHTPFAGRDMDWVEHEWSASSLPLEPASPLHSPSVKVALPNTAQRGRVSGEGGAAATKGGEAHVPPPSSPPPPHKHSAAIEMGGSVAVHMRRSNDELHNVFSSGGAGVSGAARGGTPERFGSASVRRCSSASTRQPKSPASALREPFDSVDVFSASLTACGRPADDAAGPGNAATPPPSASQPLPTPSPPPVEPRSRAALQLRSDSPLCPPAGDGVPYRMRIEPTSPLLATPTTPARSPQPLLQPWQQQQQQQQQPLIFPSLSPHAPSTSSLAHSPSPSSLNGTREKRNTLASPLSQRSVFLRTPSVAARQSDDRADSVGRHSFTNFSTSTVNNFINNNNTSNGSTTSTGDTTVFGMLSRERQRLLENTRTSAARDQLSALAVPSLYSPAQAAAAAAAASATAAPPHSGQSPTKGNSPRSRATAAAVSAGNVQHHIDALLERRRTQHVFGVSPAAEMRKSAQGFVAHMTSQLYVAPLQQPTSPGLAVKRREVSSATMPSSRSRTRADTSQSILKEGATV